jgi:hypothetical protein
MQFLGLWFNALSRHKRESSRAVSHRPRAMQLEFLEDRKLLAHPIHIPPPGLSGPGMGQFGPRSGSTPSGMGMPNIQIPPLGVSRPQPPRNRPTVTFGGSMGQGTFGGGSMGFGTTGNSMMGGLMAGGGMMGNSMMNGFM